MFQLSGLYCRSASILEVAAFQDGLLDLIIPY